MIQHSVYARVCVHFYRLKFWIRLFALQTRAAVKGKAHGSALTCGQCWVFFKSFQTSIQATGHEQVIVSKKGGIRCIHEPPCSCQAGTETDWQMMVVDVFRKPANNRTIKTLVIAIQYDDAAILARPEIYLATQEVRPFVSWNDNGKLAEKTSTLSVNSHPNLSCMPELANCIQISCSHLSPSGCTRH